jgi:hypothetical protein
MACFGGCAGGTKGGGTACMCILLQSSLQGENSWCKQGGDKEREREREREKEREKEKERDAFHLERRERDGERWDGDNTCSQKKQTLRHN